MKTHICSIATESSLRGCLPFSSSANIRQLGRFNFVVQLQFPYHSGLSFRITDDNNTWLIYPDRTAVYNHLLSLGLSLRSVVTHD